MNIVSKVLVATAFALSIVFVSASGAYATNSQSACVDGKKRSNLSVTWNSSNNVTVGTVGNKPLCEDVTLYFSSYKMPANYNGLPFANNPTASPQTIFDSTSVVLKKGINQPQTMAIDLPDECTHKQIDVYYGPEIQNVGPKGHGSQYITGKIIVKTKEDCTPVTPEEPEVPEVPEPEAQTPPTPKPEVKTPAAPAELPKTGSGFIGTFAIGSSLSALTYGAAYVATRRK